MTKDKGILYPDQASQHFSISRLPFKGKLAQFVEHVWILRWELPPETTYETEVLPYPALNIIFMDGGGQIAGTGSKKFTYRLEGSGTIVGILFRPGGIYPFVRSPLGDLIDTYLSLDGLFVGYSPEFAAELLTLSNDDILARLADFLNAQRPIPYPAAKETGEIVERISRNTTLKRVSDVAASEKIHVRRLEQLFYEYIGMSPKLVISRFRIQEAADRLRKSPDMRLTELSYELGYSDQAHFTNDFRRIIGCTPSEYLKKQNT